MTFAVFFTTPDLNPFDFTSPKSTDLQNALNSAIDAVAAPNGHTRKEPRGDPNDHANFDTVFPIPFTIADVSAANPSDGVPLAHYNGDEVDFVASEAKVAVMYGAFQLRNMVRRFVTEKGITKKADLFSKLKDLRPVILGNDKVPMLKAAKDIEGKKIVITEDMRLPHYQQALNVTEKVGGLDVDFKGKLEAAPRVLNKRGVHVPDPGSDFGHSLFEMIATSDDTLAGTCVHGIGYGFLNGALDAGGYFERPDVNDAKTYRGLWVGGDYAGQEVRGVLSLNDGAAKLAGTTHRFAQLIAAVKFKALAASDPLNEMSTLLEQAVQQTTVMENAADLGADRISKAHYKLNKIGFAELGRREGTQPLVYSECSLLASASGKNYVVAWQNLQTKPPVKEAGKMVWKGFPLYHHGHVANIIRATVKKYEGIATDPFPP